MNHLSRREFIQTTGLALASVGAGITSHAQPAEKTKMTINLVCGAIGVSAKSQMEIIEMAGRHGFGSVEARGDELAKFGGEELTALRVAMKASNVVWGAAGLAVDFRQDEEKFASGMKELPRIAAGLQRAGVTRMGTWISPSHDTLTYLQNFKQHARRLRQIASVLKDHGIRFGLEYVGTHTLLNGKKYPFLHTMAETRDLIAEIGTGNVGFILDTWHWWQAGDTVEDLLGLTNEQIVAVDLNDAPAGVPKNQQLDNKRELPCATGVIDVAAFLNALNRIGCDAPVRAEPFNAELRKLPKEEALAATARAMKKAFAFIERA